MAEIEYTPNLALAKQPTGAQEWGTVLNENFDKIDQGFGDFANAGGGLEIGDIGFAPLGVDESQNKRRYLDGQVISQAQFVSFTNKVKAAIQLNPSLATSETNWQAEVTNSPYGICGKFVIDDEVGTIRLPKYPDWSIREVGQAPVVGNGMTLGLTDGTTNYGLQAGNSNQNKYIASANAYGKNIEQYEYTGNVLSGGSTLGITTDPTKSGIIADLVNANTEDKLQGKWFIQVATGVEESVDVTREIELNNPFSLLDYKWSEYEITNASWLISNGAFQSGATYIAVYNLLLEIYNGTTTKDGVSVKLSTEAYSNTDFVINTADTTFRLPINVKLASGNAVVGNGKVLGLTNGESNFSLATRNTSIQGYNYALMGGAIGIYGQSAGSTDITSWRNVSEGVGVTKSEKSSGIETSSSGLKLYFYVGETIQDANIIVASQVLTEISKKTDKVQATEASMPSTKYTDLTLGASGTTYTAPANGWVVFGKAASGAGQYIALVSGYIINQVISNANGNILSIYIPVTKGKTFKANYSVGGATNSFRFIYAKGEE